MNLIIDRLCAELMIAEQDYRTIRHIVEFNLQNNQDFNLTPEENIILQRFLRASDALSKYIYERWQEGSEINIEKI